MSPGVALTVYKAFDDILARLRAFGDGAHWPVTPDTDLCARSPAWRKLVAPHNFNDGSIGETTLR